MDYEKLPASAVSDDMPATPPSDFFEEFVRRNYFYVISAVAFLAGCYLLMNAPFVTGSVFVRTLKSFLVLQGYELLLLGSAAAITFKIGRGGDVITLFLIALVLLLDPTFFGNAFYTMRQGVAPAWPLGVCIVSLLAAFGKFAVFKRLLRLQVSGRFLVSLGVAASVVWLAGLMFTMDVKPMQAIWYSYVLAWSPAVVISIMGEPRSAIVLKRPDGTQARGTGILIAVILPVLCLMHQVELVRVFDVNYVKWLLSPFLLAVTFICIRGPQLDEDGRVGGEWFAIADMFAFFAFFVCVGTGEYQPGIAGTNMPVALILTVFAVGGLFCYGYWKHRSVMALRHLQVYAAILTISGLAVFASQFMSSVSISWGGVFSEWLSLRTVLIALAVLLGVLAVRFRIAVLWLFCTWCCILLVFDFLPGGYLKWSLEMLQAMLVALFIFYFVMKSGQDNLKKTAICILVLGIIRCSYDPNNVTVCILVVESLCALYLYRYYREMLYLIWGIAGLVVAGLPILRYMVANVHVSVVALVLGLVFFVIGIMLTVRKSKLPSDGVEDQVPSLDREKPVYAGGDPEVEVPADNVVSPPPLPVMVPAVAEKLEQPISAPLQEPPGTIEAALDRLGEMGATPVGEFVRTVFVDDLDLGIRVIDKMPGVEWDALDVESAIKAEVIVAVLNSAAEADRPVLLIMPTSITVVQPGEDDVRSIAFKSIASIGRSFSTLAIIAHSGQVLLFKCASPLQATVVRAGLEQVVVESILQNDQSG